MIITITFLTLCSCVVSAWPSVRGAAARACLDAQASLPPTPPTPPTPPSPSPSPSASSAAASAPSNVIAEPDEPHRPQHPRSGHGSNGSNGSSKIGVDLQGLSKSGHNQYLSEYASGEMRSHLAAFARKRHEWLMQLVASQKPDSHTYAHTGIAVTYTETRRTLA
jgi:hypothetical protein